MSCQISLPPQACHPSGGGQGGVWTPYSQGSTPYPAQIFPPYPCPLFSRFFFSGTHAQNSDFLPPPHAHLTPAPCPFFVKSPPAPDPITPGPRPPCPPPYPIITRSFPLAGISNVATIMQYCRHGLFLKLFALKWQQSVKKMSW